MNKFGCLLDRIGVRSRVMEMGSKQNWVDLPYISHNILVFCENHYNHIDFVECCTQAFTLACP